jgi:predicted N-formylglutamate amidohydrolase
MLKPLVQGLLAEPDLFADDVGDNEPYDGALAGDTIDAIATSRGLANALIEIRQDLITEKKHAVSRAERIAPNSPSRPCRSRVTRAWEFWQSGPRIHSRPGKTLRGNLT